MCVYIYAELTLNFADFKFTIHKHVAPVANGNTALTIILMI